MARVWRYLGNRPAFKLNTTFCSDYKAQQFLNRRIGPTMLGIDQFLSYTLVNKLLSHVKHQGTILVSFEDIVRSLVSQLSFKLAVIV